jgi:hypothetical protein
MTAEGSTTTARAEQAASATREQATQVADSAKERARDVVHEAREQAQSTVRRVQGDIRERADQETSKFAQTLRDASRQMFAMADAGERESEQGSLAGGLVREGAQAADRLASHLDEGGLDRVMADVRTWARRNPGGFLLGAAVAGFVAGRLARNLAGDGASTGTATATPAFERHDPVPGTSPASPMAYDPGTLPPGDVTPAQAAVAGPTGSGGSE